MPRARGLLGGAVAAVAFLLGGCEYLQLAKSADKAAEPIVDKSIDEVITRLCRLPADVILRGVDRRGPDTIVGLSVFCPEYRQLFEYAGAVILREYDVEKLVEVLQRSRELVSPTP